MITLKDFEPYTDRDGLIHTNAVNPIVRDASTLNGVCYTAEAYALLALTGNEPFGELSARFREIMLKCFREPGLLQRLPRRYGTTDQEGPDDYMAFAAACSVLCAVPLMWPVLEYGKHKGSIDTWFKVPWVYNNVDPGKFTPASWFGRFPQVIAMLHWGGSADPGAFRAAWAAATLELSQRKTFENDQDAYRFSALLIIAHDNTSPAAQHPLVRLAANRWWRKFWNKGYSMRTIFARYVNNPDHPLALLWGEYETKRKGSARQYLSV